MRDSIVVAWLVSAICGIVTVAETCRAQSAPNSIALRSSTAGDGGANQKFTFIVFSKQNDANTQRVVGELTFALASRPNVAEWKVIDIKDPANRAIVDRYQLSRAPMPLVLCVAPNGAVTGVMPGRVAEKQVAASLVSPTMTRCMKSLQAGKIVVVHIMPEENMPLPAGAAAFLADSAFQARTATESFVIGDAAEGRFLRDLELDPAALSGSTVVVLAPPGALVGMFSSTATAAEIAARLHAAGKCCNDPNCKHNQKGQ